MALALAAPRHRVRRRAARPHASAWASPPAAVWASAALAACLAAPLAAHAQSADGLIATGNAPSLSSPIAATTLRTGTQPDSVTVTTSDAGASPAMAGSTPTDPTVTAVGGDPATGGTAGVAGDVTGAITAASVGEDDLFQRAGRIEGLEDDLRRLNTREQPLDGRTGVARGAADDGLGIRLGTFILRPELEQRIGNERISSQGGSATDRSYYETTARGTLTSDWSRHQLTVTGEGTFQDNIAGEGSTEPAANIDATLRLDLGAATTATLNAGYDFFREDSTDPNAVAGADTQSDVNVATAGASLARDLGLLRGTVTTKFEKTTYGSARLADGSELSQSDRNTTAGLVSARLGYALSPALVPFIEGSYLRTGYDNGADAAGYRRSSDTYAAKAGIQTDFGEKLSGELAAGYTLRQFEDERLAELDAFTLDGTLNWSPVRGTQVELALLTALEESTTPGVSGPVTYALRGGLTQQVRSNVAARLAAQYLYRNYAAGGPSDENVYTATAGLTYSLNRYLDLDGDVAFERTAPTDGGHQDQARVSLGLVLRR